MSAAHVSREQRVAVSSAADFGRVAVLLGGRSSEREVSLQTGAAVVAALETRGIDTVARDPAGRPLAELGSAGIDRVWIALHGPGGEDGALQGALQWAGLPYTGSGVMASAIAMGKLRSKQLFAANGIPTPDYYVARGVGDARVAADALGYPLIVKPTCEGSSVGMSKVFDSADLETAIAEALRFGDTALIERCLTGAETTVSILQGEALPSIRIETPRVFYDYRAKYESERTEYHCPGCDDADLEARHAGIALAAFDVLGCSGWGRVDFMADADGEPFVLEVNTVPGMTGHSLVPMAAKKQGIDFAELCWRILETSMTEAGDGA